MVAMPWAPVYFLGSETAFKLDGTKVGVLAEGISINAQWSEIVASGRMPAQNPRQTLTFETKFFFTYDASNIYARVIIYGSQFYWPDPSQGDTSPYHDDWVGGWDWHQPGNTYLPPSGDDNWFLVGSGYNNYPPPRTTAPDGVTTIGNGLISSPSALFSQADVGASVWDWDGGIAANGTVVGVDPLNNAAVINPVSIATTQNNTFVITRNEWVGVAGVGDPYGYNFHKIVQGAFGSPSYAVVNIGWRNTLINIYAPLASQMPGGKLYSIKGGKTRCRDMNNSGDTVTSAAWGFPHAEHDRAFAYIQGQSVQYGWGVAWPSFLWVPSPPAATGGGAAGAGFSQIWPWGASKGMRHFQKKEAEAWRVRQMKTADQPEREHRGQI